MSTTNTAVQAPVTIESLMAQIAELTRINQELMSKLHTTKGGNYSAGHGLSLKVSEKGAVSLYGMGRFPVTLYKAQWQRLFAAQEQIQQFIDANASKLTVKVEAAKA